MRLLYSMQCSASVSRFSLGLVMGTAVFGGGISVAMATDITYTDSSPAGTLQTTPSWSASAIGNSLFPGTTATPENSNNTVTVNYTSNTPLNYVYGGLVQNGDSVSNEVNITQSTVNKSVYGGYSSLNQDSATVEHNTIKIDQGIIKEDVYGGYVNGFSQAANAINSNNTITLSNQSSVKNLWGGYVQGTTSAVIENNHLSVDNSTVTADITGGYGVNSDSSTLSGNRIEITDGTINQNVTGAIGNAKTVTSSGNSVKINGNSQIGVGASAALQGLYHVYGSSTNAIMQADAQITSTDNTIEINGDNGKSVTVYGNVYGSYDLAFRSSNSTATNSGNKILISGNSTIKGDIYGGFASAVNASSTQNRVDLNGTAISIGGTIFGGYASDNNGIVTDPTKVRAGNVLNLNGYRGSVGGIQNFETYNWTLPSDVVNGNVLVKTGTAVNLNDTTHNIYMTADGNRLSGGDTVTLIDKTSGSWGSKDYTIKQGQFIVYDASLKQNSENDHPFILTINSAAERPVVEPPITEPPITEPPITEPPVVNPPVNPPAAKLNPQSKSYSEGRMAALALVNQAGELISTAGIDHVRTMINAKKQDVDRPVWVPFFIGNGSSERYKTGSYVDINGFNLAAGMAAGMNFAAGHKATLGAFFEYGKGNYHTYNSFTHFADVRGDGHSHYNGGGLFGRIDLANTGLGRVSELPLDQADGLYAEASLRSGRVNNKFDVGHNANVLGEFAGDYRGSYHHKSTYYGGHLAGGYVMNFDDKQSLDTYLRYLWTHINSNTVKIAHESLYFDDTNSSRLQLGGRYTYAYRDYFKPYFGAAYEYEFNGKAKAKAYEFDLDRPTLKGSTGIFELGFHLLPKRNDTALSIDVTGQGYVGKRQGGSGNVKLKYQF